LGDSGVCGLSVKDAQGLRAELGHIQEEKETLVLRLSELQEERTMFSDQLLELQTTSSVSEAEIAQEHNHRYEELHHEALSELQQQLDARSTETESLRIRLHSLAESPVQKTVEKIVYKPDPVLEAELEASREQAAKLLEEKAWLDDRFQITIREKEQKETALRVSKDEAETLRARLAHMQSELLKEKARPKPPQWSKEHMDFRAAMETASQSAAALASALAVLDGKHKNLFLQVSRICNTSEGIGMDEAIEILGDTMIFHRFKSAVNAAADRIIQMRETLEPAKPKLQVVKNPREDETK
jgi:ParB family chromosome partitioning protein